MARDIGIRGTPLQADAPLSWAIGAALGLLLLILAIVLPFIPALVWSAVVVVANGNDGVGIAGALILELPDPARVPAVREGESVEAIRAGLTGARRVIVVTTMGDSASREEVPLALAALGGDPSWHEDGEGYRQRVFSR